MKIHGNILGTTPSSWRYVLHQGFIQLCFQLSQFVHTNLLIDIISNRLRVRCPHQVSTNSFDGSLIGRNPQQHMIQVVTATFVAIGRQFKVFTEHGVRFCQHFLICQSQVIFVHWACLLAVIVYVNPLRMSQAHYF